MARAAITGVTSKQQVDIAGSAKRLPNGRVRLTMKVNGHSRWRDFNTASHQEATYLAALICMRQADQQMVTDLVISCPNDILRGHMKLGWRRGAKNLHPYQADFEAMHSKFDDVQLP